MQVWLQTPPARRPGSLADQHRIALQTEAVGLEHVRNRQQHLAGARDALLDPGKVLAVAAADDARDAIAMVAGPRRRELDETRAALLHQACRVVLEMEASRRPRRRTARGSPRPASAASSAASAIRATWRRSRRGNRRSSPSPRNRRAICCSRPRWPRRRRALRRPDATVTVGLRRSARLPPMTAAASRTATRRGTPRDYSKTRRGNGVAGGRSRP